MIPAYYVQLEAEAKELRAEVERLRALVKELGSEGEAMADLLRGKIIGQSWSSELPDFALKSKP
jgi:hypothetical protein